MPAVPEFILRKLFVSGSLKASGDGFCFELNNTLAPVTLLGLGVGADGHPCSLEEITLNASDREPVCAAAVSRQAPFALPVNAVIKVSVRAAAPRHKLTIRAVTSEVGELQFNIPLHGDEEKAAPSANPAKRFFQRVQYFVRKARARRDPQHPRLHFTAPANWLNDPNGLIYWKDKYHLFYQFNPSGAVWGNMHWGHAVSDDLLCWQHLPIALAPDPNGPDAGGCFSGCIVDDDGTPTLLYTGVFPELQCLATSHVDDLSVWQKRRLPVIAAPPPDLPQTGFRDPCVWREGAEWRMVLGSGIRGVGGAVLLYRSPDLLNWEYLGILCQGDAANREPFWTGTTWECPSFFPLGDQWVLIISALGEPLGGLYTFYFVGKYCDNRFVPDGPPRLLDDGTGGCFYAPQTFLDKDGRRLMIGWLRESRSNAQMERAGWSGAMSLPRYLTLGEDGTLRFALPHRLSALRQDLELLEQPEQTSRRMRGCCLEIVLNIRSGAAFWSGVVLAAEDNPLERIEVGYSRAKSAVVIDCRQAGGMMSEIPLPITDGEALNLRAFVDGSVLEVFLEDSRAISARFYMKNPQSLRARRVGNASVEVWGLGLA